MGIVKTYKKGTDRYGIYFKCLKCFARSEDENYIKGRFCHDAVIKTNGFIGGEAPPKFDVGEVFRNPALKHYIALVKIKDFTWRMAASHRTVEGCKKHIQNQVKGVIATKIFEIDCLSAEIKEYIDADEN